VVDGGDVQRQRAIHQLAVSINGAQAHLPDDTSRDTSDIDCSFVPYLCQFIFAAIL